jgi:2-furoyl-CoA dehydrogenase FAD binding subunit
MKPAAFDLLVADTTEAALDCLHENGDDAKIVAGGQSLMAMLNMRLVSPEILVDISRLSDLSYIRRDGRFIEIGATTTQAELQCWPELDETIPLLALALPHVGHFQTRNRGTVCGSLSHADPSSELPLALATLGGEVVLRSRKGKRVLAAGDFQTGMLSSARRADEIVMAARYPITKPGTGHAFREVARRHGDFAVVALAAVADGRTTRLGVGGLADKPTVRGFDGLEGSALEDALNAFAWDMGGADDIHATAQYRREMVRRLGRKVIEEARHAAAD